MSILSVASSHRSPIGQPAEHIKSATCRDERAVCTPHSNNQEHKRSHRAMSQTFCSRSRGGSRDRNTSASPRMHERPLRRGRRRASPRRPAAPDSVTSIFTNTGHDRSTTRARSATALATRRAMTSTSSPDTTSACSGSRASAATSERTSRAFARHDPQLLASTAINPTGAGDHAFDPRAIDDFNLGNTVNGLVGDGQRSDRRRHRRRLRRLCRRRRRHPASGAFSQRQRQCCAIRASPGLRYALDPEPRYRREVPIFPHGGRS